MGVHISKFLYLEGEGVKEGVKGEAILEQAHDNTLEFARAHGSLSFAT